jgi:hypothetical protein
MACNDNSKPIYQTAENSFRQAATAYALCTAQNPSTYTPPSNSLQPTSSQSQSNAMQTAELKTKFEGNKIIYSNMLQTVKVMMAAAEPLTEYRTILNNQLNDKKNINAKLETKIATGANEFNGIAVAFEDLSHTGPFGFSNIKLGVGYAFLAVYNLFFLVLGIVLFVRFKNSLGTIPMIIIVILLLIGAGLIEYFVLVYPIINTPNSLLFQGQVNRKL